MRGTGRYHAWIAPSAAEAFRHAGHASADRTGIWAAAAGSFRPWRILYAAVGEDSLAIAQTLAIAHARVEARFTGFCLR
jgi:hypothetical protein